MVFFFTDVVRDLNVRRGDIEDIIEEAKVANDKVRIIMTIYNLEDESDTLLHYSLNSKQIDSDPNNSGSSENSIEKS